MWPDMQKAYAGDEYVVKIRDKEIRTALTHTTLSGNKIRKVALPQYEDHGELLQVADARQRAGQLPLHRRHLRLQARGRGPDAHVRRRGRRLPHQPALQAASAKACRPSACRTAFDSVTLYGNDPDLRPDIYGKVGNSGVSASPRSTT